MKKRWVAVMLALVMVSNTMMPVLAADIDLGADPNMDEEKTEFSEQEMEMEGLNPSREIPEEEGSEFPEEERLLVQYDADSFEVRDGHVVRLQNRAESQGYDAVQEKAEFQPEYVEKSSLNEFPAMRLSSDDFLQIGEEAGFDLTDMTFVAVLKPNALDAEKSQICGRKKNNSGEHNWYWNIENKNAVNFGWKELGKDSWCSPDKTQTMVTAGEEYVLIASKEGTHGKVVINGKEIAFDGGEIPEYNGQSVYLGAPEGNSDQEVSINADICEFRIYNYALGETELTNLQTELTEKYLEEEPEEPEQPEQLPGDVEGLKIWFDANDLSMGLESGDKVAEWKNKAGDSALDAAQTNAEFQPVFVEESDLNQHPGVELDKNQYLELKEQINPDDFSVFAVVQVDSLEGSPDSNQIFSKLGTQEPWDHNWYFNLSEGGFNFGWKDDEGYHDYKNPNRKMSENVSYILGGTKDKNEGRLYLNQNKLGEIYSSAEDSAAVHNDAPIYIGGTGGQSIKGEIGEILFYDRGLSAEETEKVQAYLGEKWDIEKGEDLSELTGVIKIDGEELRAFSPGTDTYKYTVASGTEKVPEVTADFTASQAEVQVIQAEGIPGSAVVKVTKGSTVKEYTIEFSRLEREVLDLQRPELEEVQITEGFWKEKLDLFRTETVNHVFDNFERTGTLENFKNVPDGKPDGRTDPWNDGLLFETIRGASDFLRVYPDEELERRIDGYIDIVYEASMKSANGYLSTWAMMERPDKYFDETGNARWYHDCYNFGCMAEAAVHYYQATGKTKLLYVATRYAEFLVDNYGYGVKEDGTPKINMVPSHEGPEEMLLKLYKLYRDTPGLKEKVNSHCQAPAAPLTIDENEYADLVKFWIENRGNYDNRVNGTSYDVYAQDHARYFDQDVAAGHAVRANLFYTGIAAAGLEFKDYTYLESAERIWQNIVDKQMYITGGVGAQGADEAYGPNYDLPNDGYCETCAQVAMGFFSEYMVLAFGESKYADVLENYIYNGVLGCVGEDGKTFYYQQPLTDKNRGRWEWLEHTPCCPPMFLKFYGELASYIYAYDNGNTYVNQFISSEGALKNGVTINQETEMPWGGKTVLNVQGDTTLHIRIPDWADQEKVVLKIDGQEKDLNLADGYAVVAVKGSASVELELPMEARREYSDPNVVYNEGKVALAYGPLVYCVESTDNEMIPDFDRGEGNLGLPENAELTGKFEKDLLGGVQTISFDGEYYDSDGNLQSREMKAIPFYARSNRGNSATFVWIDETVKAKTGKNRRWLANATSTDDVGNSAAAAFDGNKDTYWSAGSAEVPQALIVDLGEEMEIEKICTTFTSAQAWKYQILYSLDGHEWIPYADRSENAENQQEFVDEKKEKARYVAVKFVESAGVGFISAKEVEVFDAEGINVAQNKLCASSSTSNVGKSVFGALDGEEDTRYCPRGESKPQSLTMDMGEKTAISGVHILFEKPSDWSYTVEVSDDGENWNEYINETTNLEDRTIEKETEGRYIRFSILGTTGGVWASAWEFEVLTEKEPVDIFDILFGKEEEEVTVTAEAGEHGSIDPAGTIQVKKGENLSFYVIPDEGYQIKSVTANGIGLSVVDESGEYMLEDIQENMLVRAEFEEENPENPEEPTNPEEPDNPGDSGKPEEPGRPDSGGEAEKPDGSHESGGAQTGNETGFLMFAAALLMASGGIGFLFRKRRRKV